MSIITELNSILEGVSQDDTDAWDALRQRINILNERAWEGRLNWPLVERWLQNFNGNSGLSEEVERIHALYLLSQFLYYGNVEIRVLLRAIYRDLFFLPLIQEVKQKLGGTRDINQIRTRIGQEIAATRFLGVGNPSESGVHLLYFFRQENRLSKEQFLDAAQIIERVDVPPNGTARRLRQSRVTRFIFVDDVCGSGDTAVRYSKDLLEEVHQLDPDIQFYYHAIFATANGLKNVRENSRFGQSCAAVFELDASYRCLSEVSRYLKIAPPGIDPDHVRTLARHYGELVAPGHGGGFEDSQMLIGFHHNTPDNTLPIIWMDPMNGCPIQWTPAFKRYGKY